MEHLSSELFIAWNIKNHLPCDGKTAQVVYGRNLVFSVLVWVIF